MFKKFLHMTPWHYLPIRCHSSHVPKKLALCRKKKWPRASKLASCHKKNGHVPRNWRHATKKWPCASKFASCRKKIKKNFLPCKKIALSDKFLDLII